MFNDLDLLLLDATKIIKERESELDEYYKILDTKKTPWGYYYYKGDIKTLCNEFSNIQKRLVFAKIHNEMVVINVGSYQPFITIGFNKLPDITHFILQEEIPSDVLVKQLAVIKYKRTLSKKKQLTIVEKGIFSYPSLNVRATDVKVFYRIKNNNKSQSHNLYGVEFININGVWVCDILTYYNSTYIKIGMHIASILSVLDEPNKDIYLTYLNDNVKNIDVVDKKIGYVSSLNYKLLETIYTL